MYDNAFIQQLKQTNTSADINKTKQRVEAIWKSASNENKTAVEKAAGVSRASIYRVYNTGSISAKLAVAMSQVLNVNPFYLTGESDENAPCSEVLLEQYLSDKGYGKLLGSAKRRNARKAKEAEKVEHIPSEQTMEDAHPVVEKTASKVFPNNKTTLSIKKLTPELEAYINVLSEDEVILLLKAMLLRSKADENTESMAMMVKLLLLS